MTDQGDLEAPPDDSQEVKTDSTQQSSVAVEEVVVQPLGVTKLLIFFEGSVALCQLIFLLVSIYIDTFLFVPVVILILLNVSLCTASSAYLWCHGPITLGTMLVTRVGVGIAELLYGVHVQTKAFGEFCFRNISFLQCGTSGDAQLHRFVITWIFFLAALYHLFIALLILASSDQEYDDMYHYQEVTDSLIEVNDPRPTPSPKPSTSAQAPTVTQSPSTSSAVTITRSSSTEVRYRATDPTKNKDNTCESKI